MRLLQREGFIFSGTIDLFDGGPIMSSHRDTIRTIMESDMVEISVSPSGAQGAMTLMTSGKVADFRAVLSPAQLSVNGLLVMPAAMQALGAKDFDTQVRYWQAKPKPNKIQPTLVKAHI